MLLLPESAWFLKLFLFLLLFLFLFFPCPGTLLHLDTSLGCFQPVPSDGGVVLSLLGRATAAANSLLVVLVSL